jgi:flagellar motor protein MotB
MSTNNPSPILTHHALLVVWGLYARQVGLIKAIEGVGLHQKANRHCPQTKVLEFLVAILGGLAYLKDISRSSHPLDQDQAVAEAWGQPAWADYSGVSRTLQSLTPKEATQIVEQLEAISQPFIDREVLLALRERGYLVYDADLTGRPVSNTSLTYPGVAYGYMGDAVQLGYQAAMTSLHSPSYGRLWLSTTPHPGDTVAHSQAQELVQAAERKTGVRPRRRTEMLAGRLQAAEGRLQAMLKRELANQEKLEAAKERRAKSQAQIAHGRTTLNELETLYAQRGRPQRPHSRLAQTRRRLAVYQHRLPRCQVAVDTAEQRRQWRQDKVAQLADEVLSLRHHLAQLQADNEANPNPIKALFRLDGGFGSQENVDWLIEMGYDIYTKPCSHWVKEVLEKQVTSSTRWQRVGKNAEMAAWATTSVGPYSYPLDMALARYYTGDKVRTAAFLHYGDDDVTRDLAGWFHTYNGRQSIEAGIKEGKGVFQMHHLKVRAEQALFLQEHFATFAANFVRWAAHWLVEQQGKGSPAQIHKLTQSVKQLVQVAAHTSAWVQWHGDGWLLRFTKQSLYAGHSLRVGNGAFQLPLPTNIMLI